MPSPDPGTERRKDFQQIQKRVTEINATARQFGRSIDSEWRDRISIYGSVAPEGTRWPSLRSARLT